MDFKVEEWPLSKLCAAMGREEKLLDEHFEKLQEWLALQPHLPKDMPENKLKNLIISCKFSLEVAKQKVDSYYTIKAVIPELFQDRDPLGDVLKNNHEIMTFVVLPKLTVEGYAVSISTTDHPDVSRFNFVAALKYALMVTDIRFMDYQHCIGDYIVFDLTNFSFAHITRLTPVMVKKAFVATMNGLGARIKGIHYINAPPYVGRIISIVKSNVKPKIQERILVHKDMESFYRFVPKSILPKDYGGDEMSMNELKRHWHKKIEERRDWFIEQDMVTVDESLRPGQPTNKDELFGFSGSFRKLDID